LIGSWLCLIIIEVPLSFHAYTSLDIVSISVDSLVHSFNYSITWIMLVVMLVTAVLQIVFLNRALQRFDSKASLNHHNCFAIYFRWWSSLT
jgi:hypothetical protein